MENEIRFDFNKNQIYVHKIPVGERYIFYDIHKIREEYNQLLKKLKTPPHRVFKL